MKGQTMTDIHVDGGVIASAFVTGAIAFLAWIVKVAARQALDSLKTSIDNHAHSIDKLAEKVEDMRTEVSDLKERMVRVETRQL
jgi:uncharacterized protein YoxC